MICLENVTKIYNQSIDETKALDNVSVKIDDGELVAIMGPSGSGKSTMLNIIGCMDDVTSGIYTLDGIDITDSKKCDVQKYRKEKIGFIFQNFALMDYYTAYENIELPLLANNVKKSKRRTIIEVQLKKLNIDKIQNKIPAKMSGGQRQRVAIARALVGQPSIILADEPTGALDQVTGQGVIDLLKQINNTGITVIVVTHDEKLAKQMRRIITICDGKITSDKENTIILSNGD